MGAFFCENPISESKNGFWFFLGKSKNGSWIHKIHPQGGFFGSNPNPDFWDSQSERIARLFLNPCLSCFFPTNWKNNSSASVLNSYNFTILRSVFYSRNICLVHFVHSFVAYVAFSSCLRRENQLLLLFFSTRSTRTCRCHGKWSFFGSSVFLVVKNPCDLKSQIRFWILLKKHTICLPFSQVLARRQVWIEHE